MKKQSDCKMYSFKVEDKLQEKLDKLAKRNPELTRNITKKISQIIENPYHFKPLRGELKGKRRVHIAKSFILIFLIDEDAKIVKFLEFEHHDRAYR